MKNILKSLAFLLPAYLFIFLPLAPVSAFFVQSGETLVLPKEKKIDEATFVTATSLTINSDINGDLYCVGQDVVINGNIKGDIACAGQNIKINGTVDGDVRVAGQSVEIASLISRNLTAVSQGIILGPKSNIKGDIFFGAQNIDLGGVMGRDLAGAGETVNISGSLLRNATVTSTNLSLIETGKIGGNLDYYMEKEATASIDSKSVKGSVVRHDIETSTKPEMKKDDVVRFASEAMLYKTIFGIISFAVLGLVLVYLDRRNIEKRMSLISKKPFIMGLIGFAVLVTAPLAFILLLVTIVGMPLAFVALFAYIVALITASLYPSALYGKLFLEKLLLKKDKSLYLQVGIGVILLGLVSVIPVIGWIIAFVSFCLGLGAIFSSLFPEKAKA